MSTASIELRSGARADDEERRRKRRDAMRPLLVLAGALGLALWSAEETSPPKTPPLVASETRHDFGEQPPGAAASAQIAVQNAGAAPFDLAGDGKLSASGFTVDASSCAHVEPNANCTVSATFTPGRGALQSWSFRLVGKDGSATAPIMLLGKPVVPVGAPNCDCTHVDAGLLTAGWRDGCIGREKQLMEFAAEGKLHLQFDAADKITGGELCDSAVAMGPNAWPRMGGPRTPPPNVPRATPCKPSGLVQDCGPNQ